MEAFKIMFFLKYSRRVNPGSFSAFSKFDLMMFLSMLSFSFSMVSMKCWSFQDILWMGLIVSLSESELLSILFNCLDEVQFVLKVMVTRLLNQFVVSLDLSIVYRTGVIFPL